MSIPCCQAFANAIPAVALIIIILWSYYVYVYEICILIITETMKKIIYLVFFHILFLMFVTTYFMAMCDKNWYVPSKYYFDSGFFERLLITRTDIAETALLKLFCSNKAIMVYTRTKTGNIRYCTECRLIKPDRTHHCSTCDTCVIKMDHHCPWINNCVGYTNYKYFVILVLYAGTYCIYYTGTSMEFLINFVLAFNMNRLREINIVMATVVTCALGIALWVLFFFHIRLILINETTIEAMHPPVFGTVQRMSFDLGHSNNFYETCGSNCCLWLLPVNSHRGSGVEFEVVTY